MKLLLILLTALLCSGLAGADPVDPNPDGMSIYIDEQATDFCIDDPPIYVAVPVYIVLTHPSTSDPHILSWEARVEFEGNATFGVGGEGYVQWDFFGYGVGLPLTEDLVVGTGDPPMPITGDATVLAMAELIWTTFGGYGQFSIGRVTDSATFPDGPGYSSAVGFSIPCHHIFSEPGTPCAWINPAYFWVVCESLVANEDRTWGEVKALY